MRQDGSEARVGGVPGQDADTAPPAAVPAGAAPQDQPNDGQVEADLGTVWNAIDGLVDGALAMLPRVALAVVVFTILWFVAKGLRNLVRRATRRHPSSDLGIVLGRLVRWAVVAAGFLLAVTVAVPSVKPVDLLSLLGIGSVAIGFAFKDIFQNFLAGILILLRHPFRIGDQIIYGDYEGTVEAIETRTTLLRTYDGRRVFVPNGEIFTSAITVNTAYGYRRSEVDVDVGYGDDLGRATEVLMEALRGVEGVRSDPPPQVLAVAIAESGVTLRARWWTAAKQAEVMRVKHRVVVAVREALGRAQIDIPYPTRTVLFHDQTDAADGDRMRQREGWPAGENPPSPARTADPFPRERDRGAGA
ncbi:MAG TPA: mechanosensitive ion channel family protein [Azospirillaceae bacterium]|nr:mechanosensitive ion channel family protein [Azospirillaceae bacterium]